MRISQVQFLICPLPLPPPIPTPSPPPPHKKKRQKSDTNVPWVHFCLVEGCRGNLTDFGTDLYLQSQQPFAFIWLARQIIDLFVYL